MRPIDLYIELYSIIDNTTYTPTMNYSTKQANKIGVQMIE